VADRSTRASRKTPSLGATLRAAQRKQRETLPEVRALLEQARSAGDGLAEPFEGALRELEEQSMEIAQAMQLLADQLRPVVESRRGRPRREQSVPEELVTAAPFEQLATLPAHELRGFVRRIDDVGLLVRAHEFESRHDRRASVLTALEDRLRRLGRPLGGPSEPPWEDYARASPQELTRRLGRASAARAVHAYAWEFYHARRPSLLRAAEQVGGPERCRELVRRTSPRPAEPPEPFPGYLQLTADSSMRAVVRETLAAQDTGALTRAREFELATRARRGFLRAIDRALRAQDDPGSPP
jgi:hypothetical protein